MCLNNSRVTKFLSDSVTEVCLHDGFIDFTFALLLKIHLRFLGRFLHSHSMAAVSTYKALRVRTVRTVRTQYFDFSQSLKGTPLSSIGPKGMRITNLCIYR